MKEAIVMLLIAIWLMLMSLGWGILKIISILEQLV